MKVKVIAEFKDKHSGELNKIGDELEMSAERINEVLKVGRFVEIMEQPEQSEPIEQTEPEQQEEQQEETAVQEPATAPKRTTRRRK